MENVANGKICKKGYNKQQERKRTFNLKVLDGIRSSLFYSFESSLSDQWSPLNPEGKKHYDRNFLLQVRFAEESMQKPEGLQIPDILLDSVSVQDVLQKKTNL